MSNWRWDDDRWEELMNSVPGRTRWRISFFTIALTVVLGMTIEHGFHIPQIQAMVIVGPAMFAVALLLMFRQVIVRREGVMLSLQTTVVIVLGIIAVAFYVARLVSG